MPTTANTRIGRDHYQVRITAGKNSIISDEPEENGGKDEGLRPHELFLSSLGACTCVTVRMYADRKGMNLDEIKVSLSLDWDSEKSLTNISCDIEFIGQLTPEEKQKLLDISNKCPIHKTLSYPVNIHSRVI